MTTKHHSESLNISEKGRGADGQPIYSDRRLFMQLMAWTDCDDTEPLIDALQQANVQGVLYEDVNDPYGVALLTFSEQPDYFISGMRQFLKQPPFGDLTPRPELTMFGRTYAIGYESDLESILIQRPLQRACDPNLRWVIWYPLRRGGAFEHLSPKEQSDILREHGDIGMAYGRAGYGTDIRLACHGLNTDDNDFVVALLGPELFPLSSIVERMRKTQQTSVYLKKLGPFFVGKVAWQCELPQL